MEWFISLIFVFITSVIAADLPSNCDVTAETEYGTVCGKTRTAANGDSYASFRGIRYAKAPLAELRFAAPQKPDPYDGIFDASEHGPVCPQRDVFYGPIMQPRSTSEDCLRINVNVPLTYLPGRSNGTALPVFVFVHGGGFSFGSGDSDFHGSEYLMSGRDVILVTFNYRLGAIGFLSLFSKEIPGNTGLRDAMFALKWVQNNIANFGGDPTRITLGGQSAGAVIAHMLTISPILKGENIVKGLIAFSGSSIAGFVSPTKIYSGLMSRLFLLFAGINLFQSPEGIHSDLCKAPVDKLVQANADLLNILGSVSFVPVVEEPQDGSMAILPKDPELLLDEGYGKDTPTWLGFCNNEGQTFYDRFAEINAVITINLVSILRVPLNILFDSKLLTLPILKIMVSNEYFNNTIVTIDKFLPLLTDGYFKYTALRVAEKRVKVNAFPTFVSSYGYASPNDVFKKIRKNTWEGAGHCEDLTYIFRCNSILGPDSGNELSGDNDDSRMRDMMTNFVVQFVKTGSPVPQSETSNWPSSGKELKLQNIVVPQQYDFRPPSPYLKDKKKFFDLLNQIGRGM